MTVHDLTRTPPALLRRARLTFLIVAVGVPVVLATIGAVIIAGWLPSFSKPVIVHWGFDGANGFGPASTYLWLLLGVGLLLPVGMAVMAYLSSGVHWGGSPRMLGALAAGLSAFALALTLGSLAIQRDSTVDAGVGIVMLVSFGALIVVTGAAWFAQPRVQPSPGRTLEPRHAVHVAEGERVVWLGAAAMPRGAVAVIVTSLVLIAGLAVYMIWGGVEGAWLVAVVAVILAVALATTMAFRVRITPEGFDARSFVGWPRRTIPLAEIASARAVEISPFAEFGGWGWRVAFDGRSGIVTRRGAAIEVFSRDRKPFLVTIDGAEEAAALLQAYVERGNGSAR